MASRELELGRDERAEGGGHGGSAHRLAGAVTGGLGAVATGRHVAPATTAVLRAVEEHTATTGIVTATDAAQFTGDQRVGTVIHDRHHQCGECIATGDEIARVDTLGRELQASCAGAATEDAIDLADRISARVVRNRAMFGQRAQGTADTAGIEQGGRGTCRLLLSAAHDGDPAIMIDHANGGQPLQHGAEIPQGIAAYAKLDVVRVDEIEPEAIADEHEGATIGWCDDKCGHGGLHRRRWFDVTPGMAWRKQNAVRLPAVSVPAGGAGRQAMGGPSSLGQGKRGCSTALRALRRPVRLGGPS